MAGRSVGLDKAEWRSLRIQQPGNAGKVFHGKWRHDSGASGFLTGRQSPTGIRHMDIRSPTWIHASFQGIGRQLRQTGRDMTVDPAHRVNRLSLQLSLRKGPTQERSVEAARSLYVGGVQVRVSEHINRV